MKSLPCVLAISGWDPCGGAGAAADLRAVRRAGAWGCAAISVLTVQSTAGLRASVPVAREHLLAEAREILARQDVRAIKVGALGSADNVRAVIRLLSREAAGLPVVVDPVLGASRPRKAARLFDAKALEPLLDLCALATLLTPNALEAEALTGMRVRNHDEATFAGRALVERGARAVLMKGGHIASADATDVLLLGGRVVHVTAPRFRIDAHGTGCTLASLVAGKLAAQKGALTDSFLLQAVRWAKRTLTKSIASAIHIGQGMVVLEG